MTTSGSVIAEKDETGRIFYTTVGHSPDISTKKTARTTDIKAPPQTQLFNAKSFHALGHSISAIFLPAGYPNSVTPDYLCYQMYNDVQEFCSSLSGLLASRGALEGFGVGDASASATQALLLTVLKDVCSRFTTIIGAYYFGTSLYPETKTFRFLADVINDTSIVLDTISPYFTSISLSTTSPYLPSGSTLQIVALCMSGAMRSLCGLVAGGSKAALTDHFASPVNSKGDVGELNAKSASRSTVIALTGVLLGTLIVPYITTRTSTYTALFFLVFGHLSANYLAVRSVVLRSFNRQRSSILWSTFRHPKAEAGGRSVVLTPRDVSNREIILDIPSRIRDAVANRVIGHCSLGVSVQYAMTRCNASHVLKMLQHFHEEPYVIFVAELRSWGQRGPCILVSLKEGYGSLDQLRAWLHALEIAAIWSARHMRPSPGPSEIEDMVLSTHETLRKELSRFMGCMKEAGWNIEEGAMMMGSPGSVIMSPETKKDA
ncbi:vitamin B6 photo-protection and homoeostasis-domain-containing protein [Suillus americanus]|nr:vitamin B6 photo-protection and homoeostasis-domain-containing protein [Suillus americanus]